MGRHIPMEKCEHDWEPSISSMYSNDLVTEVYCNKCHTYGEQDNETGEVFWPAT